ncbi:MAG: EthD domain-containing protein [Microcoleaceae cyanobacterium MO_207.B10]|nr:EthD domain-containing protein [Microcoleaceae cyanobacterium MO_207.B10]
MLSIRKGEKADFSSRDREGQVSFYVLLWKRPGITLELFDDYWRDVHGPVCARLPGQHQYWQLHVGHNNGGIWPTLEDPVNASTPEEQFDGIAELTFKSIEERQIWFTAAAILMDDEHNIFSKAIGYNTNPGNSITYVDRIENGAPNDITEIEKYHCMIRKADGVSLEEFRKYYKNIFVPSLAKMDGVVKLRLHLFEEVDNSRPDAGGVSHYEPAELQYQAALEIAFWNRLDLEILLASPEYQSLAKGSQAYVKEFKPFPERSAYTFVYESQMTLGGQRSSSVAQLITDIGAANQLKQDIVSLMLNQHLTSDSTESQNPTNNQNSKMIKRTNYYKDLSADYSRAYPVPPNAAKKLIEEAEKIVAMKEPVLPEIGVDYTLEQIEQENKDWWPTHCEALRQGRGDILTGEYRDDLVYFCQDGPYRGLEQQKEREQHWWALIAQPGVTMCWPIVMFFGEHTYFEWKCVDDETNETLAKGNVTWVRRGHRGACYLKTEQLTFYRDVFAPESLLKLITT